MKADVWKFWGFKNHKDSSELKLGCDSLGHFVGHELQSAFATLYAQTALVVGMD